MLMLLNCTYVRNSVVVFRHILLLFSISDVTIVFIKQITTTLMSDCCCDGCFDAVLGFVFFPSNVTHCSLKIRSIGSELDLFFYYCGSLAVMLCDDCKIARMSCLRNSQKSWLPYLD